MDVVVTASNAAGSGSKASAQTGVVTAASSSSGLNGVFVDAGHLVNGSGQTVNLRGVDREGTEYTCSPNGYGITDGPGSTATNPTEFGPMESWGIKSVMIPLNEDCWLGINGSSVNNFPADSGTNYINEIKAEVSQAEADGIYPVLTLFALDPGTEIPNAAGLNGAGGSDPNGVEQPPMPDNDHSPLFWEEVAQTFKNDPNVMFRLQEEPRPSATGPNGQGATKSDGFGSGVYQWQCWSKGSVQYSTSSVSQTYGVAPTPTATGDNCDEYGTNGSTLYKTVGFQSLINIIRGVGANNVIQVPGVAFANMAACSATTNPNSCGMLDSADGVKLSDPTSSSDGPQLMADFDIYPDNGQICDNTTCYQDTLLPLIQSGMPVDLGEVANDGSSGVSTQTLTLLNWLDSQGSGNYYSWAWDTWSDLISSYSGTPASGWGTTYYDWISPSGAPANTSAPTISGTPQQGQTLTANAGTWSPSGAPTGYQWQSCTSSTGGCSNISGATGQTYSPAGSDVGNYLKVAITEADWAGSASASSSESGQVQAPAQPTDGIRFAQANSATCMATPSQTINLSGAVAAGDTLIMTVAGMEYASPDTKLPTAVSDNVNGTWTQVTDTGSKYYTGQSNFNESYAVYEYQNSKAAPNGLTVTVSNSSGNGNDSAVVADISGVGSQPSTAFDSSPQANNTNIYTGPALSSVAANDVVLGIFGAYSHAGEVFTTPSGWNTSSTLWASANGCGSVAMDWQQPSTAGSVTPTIDSNNTEFHYDGGIDLRP